MRYVLTSSNCGFCRDLSNELIYSFLLQHNCSSDKIADSNGEMSDDDIIINEKDGLPNVHPNLLCEAEMENSEHEGDDEFDDLPASLIVTNIHDSVFISTGNETALR